MMYYIGCDPDTSNLAMAVVDDNDRCIAVYCIKQGGTENKVSRQSVLSMAQALQSFMMGTQMPQPEHVAGWVVEGQELYLDGPHKTPNPRSIMFLTAIAGAVISTLTAYYPDCRSFMPAPQGWKGSIPKEVHQTRLCGKMGWEYRLAGGKNSHCVLDVPPKGIIGADLLNPGDWKHVLDAVALALWAKDQVLTINRIKDAVDANTVANNVAVVAAQPRTTRKLRGIRPPTAPRRGPKRR